MSSTSASMLNGLGVLKLVYISFQVWIFVSEETIGDDGGECSNENHSHNQTSWEPLQAAICATGLRAASDGRFAWPTNSTALPVVSLSFPPVSSVSYRRLVSLAVLLTIRVTLWAKFREGGISALIRNTRARVKRAEERWESSTFFTLNLKKYHIPRQKSTKFTTTLEVRHLVIQQGLQELFHKIKIDFSLTKTSKYQSLLPIIFTESVVLRGHRLFKK